MRKTLKRVFWIFLVLFIVRVFIFQSYKVDNFSMSSTLLPGDRVLVNKLVTGSRIPNSLIGLPGANRSYIDLFRIPYLRFPGFRKFQRNDIVVFNDPRISDIPMDRSPLNISRIGGLAGDTIYILDKDLYVNQNRYFFPETVRHLYRIITDGEPIPQDFVVKYNLDEPILIADMGIYDLGMDSIAVEAIQKIPSVKNVRMLKQFSGDSSKGYFPYSSFFPWNRDQFGPLIVPYEGQAVDLTLKNIDLYREIIDIYEGNELLVDFSGITINGRKAAKYTFKKDYFFVMDDNQADPNDSRLIGFIPESHLLGRSKRILYSGKSRFEHLKVSGLKRFLKKID